MIKLSTIVIASLSISLTAGAVTGKSKFKPVHKIAVLQTAGTDVLSKVPDESDYAKMAALVKTANLQTALKSIGPYTVFAPTNSAFRELATAKMDSLNNNPTALAAMLRAHIVKGKFTKAQIIAGLTAGKGKMKLATIDGKPLKLVLNSNSKLEVSDADGNKAQIVSLDMLGTNSVLHGINNILMSAK